MKKIIALILMFVLLTCSVFSAFASDEYSTLRALKIIPKEVSEVNADELISRETFAFMAAKMMGVGNLPKTQTVFADVTNEDAYSGYINYLVARGVLSGNGNGGFNPKGNVTIGAAYKIVVTLLGYGELAERLGGFSGGYENVATELKLYSGVKTVDGYLTKGGAVALINNTLSAPMANNEHFIANGEMILNTEMDKGETILNDVCGLSVYSAFVDGVNQERKSVDVTIIKNRYSSNNVVLNKGDKVTFTYGDDIDALSCRYAPVIIMVDEEENVVGIEKADDVEITVGRITSVNGNKDKNTKPFKPSSIERLTVLDNETEFDVSENLRVYHNESLATSSVYLVGRIARIVTWDDALVSIETWDLTEGGIITEVGDEIVYTKGNVSGMKIRDLDTFKNKLVYIDGESASFDDVKTDTLFDYYKNGDTLVMVISEKFITDTLYTVRNDGFEIGGFIYSKGDKVYYKNTSGEFRDNAGYTGYLNTDIKAYVDPSGNVRYIEPMQGDVSAENIYFAMVMGYEKESLDDDIVSLKLLRLRPTVEERIVKINKNTVFYNNLSKNSLITNSKKADNSNVYEFEVRENGKVAAIRKPAYIKGFENASATNEEDRNKAQRDITSFVYDGTAMISVHSKPLYFKGVPLTFVFDGEGGIEAQNIDWSQIYGNSCKATVSFYVHTSNEYSSLPDLVFVSGDGVKDLCQKNTKYGIASGKRIALNDDGEECVLVDVYTGSGKTSYKVSKETADKLKNRSFITFQDGAFFSKEDILVKSIVDLSGVPSKWSGLVSGYGATGVHIGTVEKIDNLRIWAKEDSGKVDVNFYHPSTNFFLEIDTQSPNNSVKNISFADITQGDTVIYHVTTDGVRGVVRIK